MNTVKIFPLESFTIYGILRRSKATNLVWPDPIFVQGHYRLQYKSPTRRGSGPVHRPDWNRDHHCGGGC